jgi:hypothetical protein
VPQLTVEDIVRKYTKGGQNGNGQSMAAIARFGRIPRTKVREVLEEAGVPIRNIPRDQQTHVAHVLAEHGDEIVRLYQEGQSSKSLSQKFGVSSHTILRYLGDRGVKRNRSEAIRYRKRRSAKPS